MNNTGTKKRPFFIHRLSTGIYPLSHALITQHPGQDLEILVDAAILAAQLLYLAASMQYSNAAEILSIFSLNDAS